ncbi:internal scaffolding protein [Microviridae sp.]|nr:internal scaffolding protein [Microviridae sp.]
MTTTFRKPYVSFPRRRASTPGESMTKQSFKKECDINHLMARYQKTGMLEHVSRYQGDYTDLTEVPEYHDAMNKIISADQAFGLLPSSVRKRFNNNPADFLAFVDDPSNLDEMRELGLLPEEPQQPVVASDTLAPPVGDSDPPA